MNLNKLILKDFLTYEYLEHDFERRPLLVQGLNLTDDKQKTNGTGKSGMQTGIEFCITASNSRDVRDAELVTYDKKEASAQLFASCDTRKQHLHIDWTIKVKGSNVLVLKTKQYGADEWINVSFSNVNDGKKFITDWFAISKEDLFNYYIINKTRFKSFFKSSNKEKVDLINRFSDASIIEGLEKIDTSELDSQFKEAERLVSNTEGKIELIQDQIQKENDRDFKQEIKEEELEMLEEIEEIKQYIVELNQSITVKNASIKSIKDDDIKQLKVEKVDAEKEKIKLEQKIIISNNNIKVLNGEFDSAQILVDEFISTNWNEERLDFEKSIIEDQTKLQEQEQKKQKLNNQETQILTFIQKIEIVLGGAIDCPKCAHQFLLDASVDLDEQKQKKVSAQGLRLQVEKSKAINGDSIVEIREAIRGFEKLVSTINKKQELENQAKNLLVQLVNQVNQKVTLAQRSHNELKQELKLCQSDMDDFDRQITNLNARVVIDTKEVENIKKEIENFKDQIQDYRGQIKALKVGDNKELIKTLQSDLSRLHAAQIHSKHNVLAIGDKIYEANQWMNNFKQFRTFLANQSLDIIEYHCNRYLMDMGSDLRVKMEGFKMLSNGTIKDDITAKIIRDRERSFSSFSGGEQGRLLFASILANRHMINETHPYGGLDFLSIDEVFEGVDSVGLKHLIKSAKTLKIPVMIITHVTDEDTSGDVITIVKENGISTIRKQFQ